MAFRTLAQLMGLTTPVPASTTKPAGHPDAECRFSPFGESATAENVNRPHYALAENTDYLKAAFSRDIGLPVVAEYVCGGGINQIEIDPSGDTLGDINFTGTIYLGESGWTGQERRDQLFQVLDENYQEVSVDGNEVVVAAILGGNSLGDGFVNTLTTLGLSEPLPAGIYKIGYYEGTTLEDLPPWAFTHAGLRGLEEVSGELKEHKARLEIVQLNSHTGTTAVIDPTAGGGGDWDIIPAGYVYLGNSSYTGGGAEQRELLFQILDENYNPVVVDGSIVTVSAVSPALGNGFYDGGLVTITFSDTLPLGNYRLLLGRDDSIADLADDALVKGMTRSAHRHPTYEAFTAVLTDGTNSTGGDYNGEDAIDALASDPYGGRYLLKRGRYTWSSLSSLLKPNVSVVGELLQWWSSELNDVTSLSVPSSIASYFKIGGQYENVFLSSDSSIYSLKLVDPCRLKNVNISPGTTVIQGDIAWDGGTTEHSLTGSAVSSSYGMFFSSEANGVVENVKFYPPPSGDQLAAVAIYDPLIDKRLTFRNCTFDSSSVAGCHAITTGTMAGGVRFENCYIVGSDGGYCVTSTSSSAYTKVEFVDCTFKNDYGYLVNSDKGMSFKNCWFVSGDSNRGGAITAVNTTTDTFTVSGDHSALSPGNRIYIQGSTANDGYWTVSTTSGTGPTDITVSEDVTDGTVNGVVGYSDNTPVFQLRCGFIENCRLTLGEGNVRRYDGQDIPVKLGLNTSTGHLHVDGFEILASFDCTVMQTLIRMVGYNTPDYNRTFRDVTITNLPKPIVSRQGHAWVQVLGYDNDYPRRNVYVENLKITTATASAKIGVNDTGRILDIYNAYVNGLILDSQAPHVGGDGSIGYNSGVLSVEFSVLKDIDYCTSNAFRCTGTHIIKANHSEIIGGAIRKIGSYAGASTLLFGPTGVNWGSTVIRNMQCEDITDFLPGFEFASSTAANNRIINNFFQFDVGITSTSAFLFTLGGRTLFLGNHITCKRSTNEIATIASSSYIDGNFVSYSSGGGVPAWAGSATVGENILINS